MSTTNPDPGRPEKVADPVGGLAPTAPGSPRADDHDVSGHPHAATVARGHEPDVYDSRSVFSVPLLVIVFFVLAFGTTTVLFYFLAPSHVDPAANPQAVERNEAPLNVRIDRIGHGKEVDQPRLEPLRTRSGDAHAITRPELPGNPPLLHPDDIRPTPKNTPELYRSGTDPNNKGVSRTPIDQLMGRDGLFQAQQASVGPTPSWNTPTASNAGRGAWGYRAEPPKPPAEAKKEQVPGKAPEPKDKKENKEEKKDEKKDKGGKS